MKLYNLDTASEFEVKKRNVQLSQWETDEVLFKNEFQKLKKGQIVIDVGSEYGYYAIKAAKLVGSNGKVLAIEPHPVTFKLLKMNIKLHKVSDRVIPIQMAVGKQKGQAKLYETLSLGSTSIIPPQSVFKLNKARMIAWLNYLKRGSIFNIIRKRYSQSRIIVPMDTLDNITKKFDLKKIDLVKIDVEGAELDVLQGSHEILTKYKPTLLVEVHFGYSWKPEILYALLKKFDYKLIVEERTIKALVVARPNA